MKGSLSINSIVFLLLILVIIVLLFMLVRVLAQQKKDKKEKKEYEEKYKELEIKIQGMEMETIKYKLSPHLFKNTLNAIQSHAYQTYYSLDKLSNVLDFILYESDRKFISLKEEMEFALNLIEIHRIKVSPLFDLRVRNKVNELHPFYQQQLISPLITIDLIENAFKHADLQNENAFISIVFDLNDKEFTLTVSNKVSHAPALKKQHGGIGKENLERRLAIVYGDHYKIERFIEGDTHIAHLKLYLLDYKTEMLTVG